MAQSETPYAEKTFGDRNRVKRYLQHKRLNDALAIADGLPEPDLVVDFGAGNGEFCKWLARRYPRARICCYEPHPLLLQQARDNLAGQPRIEFAARAAELPRQQAGLVFCLEVFEHLPAAESSQALGQIERLLGPRGHLVIGVPVEVGLPALYKGAFRMFRRYGEFDARVANVLRCAIGRPPAVRPTVELMPGSHYHLQHLGFDHRAFFLDLGRHFTRLKQSSSPLRWAGSWVNPEINLLLGKGGCA